MFFKFQSTHPYGVRQYLTLFTFCSGGFNPRTRTGCDLISNLDSQLVIVSIHAPVRGATIFCITLRTIGGFNPRTRTGCDSCYNCSSPGLWFQSTHPYGVRRHQIHAPYVSCQFQSTHPYGVRQQQYVSGCVVTVSIHAPVRGATGEKDGGAKGDNVSIHAPVRGATFTNRYPLYT